MATDPIYTLKDLAERTGIEYNTLRQWKLRGHLPAPTFTIGQSPAWSGKKIEDWLASNPAAANPYNRKASA